MAFTMKDAQNPNFSEMIKKVNNPSLPKSEKLVKNHVEESKTKKKKETKKELTINEMNQKQLLLYANEKKIKLSTNEKKLEKDELKELILELLSG